MTPDAESKKRLHDLMDSTLAHSVALVNSAVEAGKLRIAFTERLIILNGATLALSFTALTSATARQIPIQHLQDSAYLVTAWKCLIFSIIFSLLGQWFGGSSVSSQNISGHLKAISSLRDMLQAEITRLFPESGTTLSGEALITKSTSRLDRASVVAHRLATALVLAAQGFSIAGFVWFYKFAASNFGGN